MKRVSRPPPNPNQTLARTRSRETVELLPGYAAPRPNEAAQPLTVPNPDVEPPELRTARAKIPSSVIEKEFVYNLQQQIYFLELQSKMLKDKLSETGPKLKSRSVEANPLLDKALNGTLPLQEYIEGLQNAYAEQEERFTKEIVELKQELSQVKEALVAATAEAKVCREQVAGLPEERQKYEERVLHRFQELVARNEDTERQLGAARFDLETRLEEIRKLREILDARAQECSSLAEEKHALTQRLQNATNDFLSPARAEEREQEVARLTAELKDAQQQLGYLNDELKTAREQQQNATSQRWALQKDVDGKASQIRELTAALQSLREENSTLMQSLSNTRQRLEDVEAAERQWRQKYSDLSAESNDLLKDARARDELQKRRVAEAESRKEFYERQNVAFAQEREHLEKNNEVLKASLDVATRRLDELREEVSTLREHAHSQLAEAKTIGQQNEHLLEKNEELNASLLEQRIQLERCHAELDLMQEELTAKRALESINLEEFAALQRTNEELASTIQSLTSRFSRLGSSARSFESRGWKMSGEHQLARVAAQCFESELPSASGSPIGRRGQSGVPSPRTHKPGSM